MRSATSGEFTGRGFEIHFDVFPWDLSHGLLWVLLWRLCTRIESRGSLVPLGNSAINSLGNEE
jgi:hypothetical protein